MEIQAGRSFFFLWADDTLLLTDSAFDVGTTIVFGFDQGAVFSFRSGRSQFFNNLVELQQWQAYFCIASDNLTIPVATLGFGNPPSVAIALENGDLLLLENGDIFIYE